MLLAGTLLKMASTLWIFSQPLIFPNEVFEYVIGSTTYYKIKDKNFYDRIFLLGGFEYFILLCSSVFFVLFLSPLFYKIIKRCCIKKSINSNNDMHFTEETAKIYK